MSDKKMAKIFLEGEDETRIEIGWAQYEQMVNGGLVLQGFIMGNYWVQTNNVPEQLHIKGTLPASLRKD